MNTIPPTPLIYNGKSLEEGALPVLPTVLHEATALMRNNKASVAKIAETLSRDQSLSAKILKTVNSPVYGFAGRISTVQNAVALLGFNVIYNITISSVASEAMAGTMKGMWQHSYGCSLACGNIAKFLGFENISEYVVAGLLHDFGKSIVMNSFPDAYREIEKTVAREDTLFYEAEKSVMGFTHVQVNAWIASQWMLPPSLTHAMTYHHTPLNAPGHVPLVCVVHLADFLVRLFEYGNGGDVNVSRLDFGILRHLPLHKDALPNLIDDIGDLFESQTQNSFA